MKWLSDYVKTELSSREYAEAMTMSGSMVEGFEVEGSELSGVVVGRVLSVERHPNADSLVICSIDIGREEPVQIVTGATNVVPEAYVPVATDGSTLTGGVKIKKGKLRGEVSMGMLCSLGELGLPGHDFPHAIENGIFLLEGEYTPGQDIREAIGLNDTVMEFEITSNRPDCLSVIGLARETAATFDLPLELPQPVVKGGGGKLEDYLAVTVENATLCPRYTARAVTNVKIEPSPLWMRERLRASGVRPINNIVDITNYVMLEYGHPMHAFDLRHVAGNKLVVRNAQPDETIVTLDGTTRTLSPEMLVIADEKAPSAVAGIMGGEFSGVYEDTKTIIFEAACFEPVSVRTTSKKLGLRTESSGRFEKGLDPENCLPALQRACQLVELLGAGQVVDGIIDINNAPKWEVAVPLEPQWQNAHLGLSLSQEEMEKILRSLHFEIKDGVVYPPSFRRDVECKADLSEEIARIFGYNNIPTTIMRGLAQGKLTHEQKLERSICDALLGQGYSEIITYSFISPKYYDRIGLPADSPLRKSVVISNPLGEDTSVMRTTTIPSMLETLSRNYNNRNACARLYEIGTQYTPNGEGQLPNESKQVTLGQYGSNCDYFTLKGAVEVLLDTLNICNWDVEAVTDHPTFHPGRCARLSVNGEELGILGEIHPQVCETYGIGSRAYVANLDFDALARQSVCEKQYRPLPKFPASTRDLALVCAECVPVQSMEKAVKTAVGSLVEKVELFDVYRGKQVGEGKKSVAFNITLRAGDHTLTDEESDRAVKKLLRALEELGAELRG